MKKTLTIFLAILLFTITLGGFFYYKINTAFFQEEYGLTISEDMNFKRTITLLEDQKVISNSLFSVWLAKLKRVSKLKSGYYAFKKGTSANEFVNRLRAGRQSPIKLTFNNARLLPDFAGKIASQLQQDSTTFAQFLLDKETAKSYGFDQANFISMFIPNTYEVYYTASPKNIADRMHTEYQRFWNTARKQKAAKLNYTPQQISTLASIVDEETNKKDEKARIAGVYLNRLRLGIPLQADPTLKFAAGDFSIKRLLNKHINIESPYNTYQNVGLPPGPIRQASISAIDAVLNAEKHDYLYFCAKADFSGYHAFAKNLAKHNQNAAAYHRELNKRGIR